MTTKFPNLGIEIPFLFDYNSTTVTKYLKGDPAMETTKLETLREMVGRLAEDCTDEDLLDLICKLLMQPMVKNM